MERPALLHVPPQACSLATAHLTLRFYPLSPPQGIEAVEFSPQVMALLAKRAEQNQKLAFLEQVQALEEAERARR